MATGALIPRLAGLVSLGVLLWLSRSRVLQRMNSGAWSRRKAAASIGLIWASFPWLFEATSGQTPNMLAASIASGALFLATATTALVAGRLRADRSDVT
jgi:hypothetical protein